MNDSILKQYLTDAEDTFSGIALYNREDVLTNPSLTSYREALTKEAETLRKESLCELPFHAFKQFDTNGNRLSYENLYFHRRRDLGISALAAWLFEDEEYLSLTEDYLWAVCNEFTWALPAHMDGNSLNEKADPLTLDLFSTETAQTLAEIVYLLKDRLHPAVVFRCRSEIERRIFTPYLTRTTPYWWESCHINWAAVCGGSIGMAAIYCIEAPDRLTKILSQLLPVMEHFLCGFENDGACLEGLSYWTYGMSYFTSFADLLSKRSGGKIDLLSQDKVKSIAAFQGKCYFTGGHTVSFSDASCTDTFRIGITSYLARYFNYEIPLPPASSAAPFGSDPCARWCQMFRDFVWTAAPCPNDTDKADGTAPFPAMDSASSSCSACVLPDAKWLIFHGSDASGGAIKGGHNDEPHNHNDVGSFFFLLHGKEVLADLGAGEYTKDSFSDRRYTIFTNHSFSHNVPVINGRGQKAGREYAAGNYLFSDGHAVSGGNSPDTDNICASMEISPAYGEENLTSLVRSLRFDDTHHQLTLCDRYTFISPCQSLEERFITRQKPVLHDNTVSLFSESGESCSLHYDSGLLTASLSTDIHRRHEDGAEETIYLLHFILKQPAVSPVLSFTLCW